MAVVSRCRPLPGGCLNDDNLKEAGAKPVPDGDRAGVGRTVRQQQSRLLSAKMLYLRHVFQNHGEVRVG
jgi:hypothetical protein